MTILNVVQPDEIDPSGFEVVDGKLTPKISSHPDNILEITPDGLYAAGGSGGSVLGRYRYDTSVNGEVIHKGIVFDFIVIDGAIAGNIYGVNFEDITSEDTIYYNGEIQGSMSDDAKLLLQLKWATENVQRFIITLFRNGGVPEIWSVQVTPTGDNVIVIIDEMVDIGEPSTGNGGEDSGSDGGGSIPDQNMSVITYAHAASSGSPYYLVTGEDDKILRGVGVGENKQPDYGNVIFHSASDPSSPDKPCVVVDDPTGASVIRNGTVVNYYNPLTKSFVKDAFKDIHELQAEDTIHVTTSSEGMIYAAIVQPNEGYKLNYLTSPNNDKGEFIPSLPVNAEVMSVGIAGNRYHFVLLIDGGMKLYTYNFTNPTSSAEVKQFDNDTSGLKSVQVHSLGLGCAITEFRYNDRAEYIALGNNPFTGSEFDTPTLITSPNVSLNGVDFNKFMLDINGFAFRATAINPNTFGFVTITLGLMAGSLTVSEAPIPQEYLNVIYSGLQALFFQVDTLIGFQNDATGRVVTLVESGSDGGISQGAPIAVFGTNEDLAFINTMGPGDRSMGVYAYQAGVGISSPNLLTPHEVKETSLIFGADKGILAYVTQEGSVRLIHEGGNGFIETTLGTIPITPQNISDIDNGRYYPRLVIQMVDELTIAVTLGNSGEVHVFKCDVLGQNVNYKKVLVQPYQEDIDNYGREITDYSCMGLSGNRIIISAAVVNDERGKYKRVYVTDIDSGLTVHTYLDDSTDVVNRNIDVIGQNHNHFLTVTEARNDNEMGANVFTLWQINSDLSCSLIAREETVGISPFNPLNPTNWNGNKIHNFYQFNDRSGWMDVVVNTTERTINFNVLELTPELTEAGGIFVWDGMPETAVMRVSPSTDEVTTIFIGGGITVDKIKAFEVQFVPFIPKTKVPKQLVYSTGRSRLVADVEPVDGGYSLYRTIGDPGDVVSIFEGDVAIDKIANVSSHLAYSYNKDIYAYVKNGFVHVRSLNGSVAPFSQQYTTNARDMEVSQVTIHDGADNLLIAVFVPDTTDTGISRTHQYQVSYGTGTVNSLGEYRNNLNGTVMSAGIAITDRYVITQVPTNDGTTVVRLNPRDGFGTIVEKVTLPISGMERLVSLGGMYFGALMPINMASSEPFMFVTYKVIDSRNIQQVAIHTARFDTFYPNGVGGANKNGQTLDDGRIAFLYTANAIADNYGVGGQTFGAFVIDPNTDTVVRQGMVPGGMVDASLNRPLDKMPVCISYGGSLVLECQHSPAELVGTFWMGISPS